MRVRYSEMRFVVLAALMLAAACVKYPVRFERVDADQLRVMDFMYMNLSDTTAGLCEAAPGDSMLLIACFSGKRVSTIEFDVSWNVFSSPYGGDTAYGREPLACEGVVLDTSAFTDSTDIVAVKFQVPPDVLVKSASIDESVVAALGFSKEQLLALVDGLARMSPEQRRADSLLAPVMEQFAGMAMQMLSAPVKIYVTVNGVNKVESGITVRYNRHFRGYDDVYMNRNPMVSFVGMYKIKGSRVPSGLGDLRDEDSTFSLFSRGDTHDPTLMGREENTVSRDTILIDTGYTYYLAVDSGVFAGQDVRDRARAMLFNVDNVDVSLAPERPERFSARWFYQHNTDEAEGVATERLFVTASGGGIVTQALPPLTTAISRVSLWVQVFDEFWGEWHRPIGSTLIETELHFRYSEAYADSLAG